MKEFRWAAGHKAGQTMTVSELRDKLAKFPNDMPVFAIWESVSGYIEPQNFSVKIIHKGNKEDACECLTIDVGQY